MSIGAGLDRRDTIDKSADDRDGFVASWPEIDAETGLSLRGDELLIKAREAMIARSTASIAPD